MHGSASRTGNMTRSLLGLIDLRREGGAQSAFITPALIMSEDQQYRLEPGQEVTGRRYAINQEVPS